MSDIQSPAVLYFKAGLFLLVGLIASTILILEHPSLRVTLLLCVSIWAFCRAYYFVFYVIEHYIDPNHRFAGLWAFARYAAKRGRIKG